MTGRKSTEPLTPTQLAEIAEDHWQANTGQHAERCDFCGDGWPCGPKLLLAEVDRLTEALTAERARVQQSRALALTDEQAASIHDGALTDYDLMSGGFAAGVEALRAALAGETEGKS